MKHIAPIALAASLGLAACNSPDTPDDQVATVDLEGQPGDPAPPPPEPFSTDNAVDHSGQPDLTPAPLGPALERTETGARNVLLSFARAIEIGEFDQAWAMLSDADKAKWPKTEWRNLFADLDEITVAVPGGKMEGAAGSSYYTSDATITATDAEGRPIRYEGPIVLRRVNDVPGASAEQLRWHLESVELDGTH